MRFPVRHPRTVLAGERGSAAGSVIFVIFAALTMTAIVAAVMATFAAAGAANTRTGTGDSAGAAYEIYLDTAITGAPAPAEHCTGNYCGDVTSTADSGDLRTVTVEGSFGGKATAPKLLTLHKLAPTMITGFDSLGNPVWADSADTTPYRFTRLASSGNTSCGLEEDKTILCWGENSSGQLGDDSTTARPSPVKVTGTTTYKALAGTGATTCALTTDGTARCWGDNTDGQLGTGAATVGTDSKIPVTPTGGHTFTSLAVSGTTVCGIDETKAAWCWGQNPGKGATGPSPEPVAVAGGHQFTALALDNATACGLDTTGKIWCWTDSASGRTGSGPSPAPGVPVEVAGGRTYTAVYAAPQQTSGVSVLCALDSTSAAWCWGANGSGQLGNNSTTASDVPVQVAGGHAFTALALTPSTVCGLDDTKKPWCWGDNSAEQLGNGGTTGSDVPVATDAAATYKGLAAATGHGKFFCGTLTAGTVKCWGANGSGQTKPGATGNTTTPTVVAGLKNITALAAGTAFACATDNRSAATCWGANGSGQTGTGATSTSADPAPATRKDIQPSRFAGILKGGL